MRDDAAELRGLGEGVGKMDGVVVSRHGGESGDIRPRNNAPAFVLVADIDFIKCDAWHLQTPCILSGCINAVPDAPLSNERRGRAVIQGAGICEDAPKIRNSLPSYQ
jgi:hypothetical protein